MSSSPRSSLLLALDTRSCSATHLTSPPRSALTPSLCPALWTGEMFLFGWNIMCAPYLTFRRVSPDGVMSPPVPISLPHRVMMHDFAITQRYAVFIDCPLIFRVAHLLRGFPFKWDTRRSTRFGILPRYATSEREMRWFELPSQFISHVANAWEEEGAEGGGGQEGRQE